MQIETYEVEQLDQNEIQALAADGEAALLIESLGLVGQQKLQNPETKTVIPYRLITKEEKFAFETNFPKKCEMKDYSDGPIPLRVLQAAAHVKELNMTDMAYLQVWYPSAGKDDPVLVARPNYYNNPIYLIARWGNALKPLSELFEKGVEIITATVKSKLLTVQREVQTKIDNLHDEVRAKCLEGDAPNCYFSF